MFWPFPPGTGRHADTTRAQPFHANRKYDRLTDRFTQEDPIGLAGGLNLYGYAGGDPVNFSDPFGLCPRCDDIAEAGEALQSLPHPLARAAGKGLVVGAAVAAAASAVRDLDGLTSVTYTRTSPSGQVYTGRTSGFGDPATLVARRAARHPARLAGFGPAIPDKSASGVKGAMAIAGREQQLIDFNGGSMSDGGTSANMIRAVGKGNGMGLILFQMSNARFGPLAPFTGYPEK